MTDKTPPSIDNGSFVSWSGGKGRVDLIVRTGKVPGVEGDVEATSDSPAARVVVWEDGKPTKKKIGASTHTLRRIPPLDGSGSKTDPAAALVALHAAHVEAVEGKSQAAALTGQAIKTAYDRGVAAWPGFEVTSLSAEEWGLGRAKHLSAVAASEAKDALNDGDLLDPTHPAADAPDDADTSDLGSIDLPDVTLLTDEDAALPDSPGAIDLSPDDDDPTEPAGEDDVSTEGEGATVTQDDLDALLAGIRADSAVDDGGDGAPTRQ